MCVYLFRQVFRHILWWWLRCAQDAGCLMPEYKRGCKFQDRYKQYADCHRFDQSAINIIMSNIWLRDNRMLYTANERFFTVERRVTHRYKIKTCKTTSV